MATYPVPVAPDSPNLVSQVRAVKSKKKLDRKKPQKVSNFLPINSLNQFSGAQASPRNLSPFGMSEIS